MVNASADHRAPLERQRWRLLHQLVSTFEPIVAVLGLVWLVLLIVGLTRGLRPGLQTAANVIWAVFIVDFILEFTVAPKKVRYLRHHWLVAASLAIPSLRVLRFARVARLARLARSLQ